MEFQKIAVLPTGDFAAVDGLNEVELRQLPQDVWGDFCFGTGGERTVLEQSVEIPSPASLGGPVPESERRYQVVLEVTEAEFEALAEAERSPTLMQWNDQSQAILGTDLTRAFIAAIQSVDDKYEDLHPADGDNVQHDGMDAMTVPVMQELLSAFCMLYDNHPEVGTWWHGNRDETQALLDKYPLVRSFAEKALAEWKEEQAKYEAAYSAFVDERSEPPEFPTYVGWDGKEHAEF